MLNLPQEIALGYGQSRTLYRHCRAIRRYLNVIPFNQTAHKFIMQVVSETAQVMDNPADLINVALKELIKQCYELPGFRTLDM